MNIYHIIGKTTSGAAAVIQVRADTPSDALRIAALTLMQPVVLF